MAKLLILIAVFAVILVAFLGCLTVIVNPQVAESSNDVTAQDYVDAVQEPTADGASLFGEVFGLNK